MQLVVTANKLNRRSSPPVSLADKNIIGTVLKGFRFDGEEVQDVPNPALGKWYMDHDNACYWGGGLVIEKPITVSPLRVTNISNLPINLPNDFRLGIDISHHNDKPDWNAIEAAGVSFCFIKISEGVGTRDKKAKEHRNNAKSIGLKIGYYHFCRPDTRNGGTIELDATAEAEEALNVITTLQPPDLPLVLDLEDQLHWDTPLKPLNYLQWVQTFINRIERQPGMTAIIYSRKNYLDSKLPLTHNLGNHKLWIANYSQKDCNRVLCPNGWGDWALWQFTESGTIGNSSQLDINILKDLSLLA
jgi:lysozyme